MTKTPNTIRYRDEPDLEEQLTMHRVNALAWSLHHSVLVQSLKPPQSVPYASPRTDAAGSDVAQRHVDVLTQLAENERLYREADSLDWQMHARLDNQRERLKHRQARLELELSALPYSRGSKPGIPGLYAVTVPPVLLQTAGENVGEGMRAGENWELDIRALEVGLRAAAVRYLDSGASMEPYYHCAKRSRYYATSRMSADTRRLFADLLAHAERRDIVLVRLKTA